MSIWTIPVVVSDVRATPHPAVMGPQWPNRNFGLIGILTISTTNTPGAYQGSMMFTKPPSFFAGKVYPIATQYITGSPVITITIPQAASDCQQNFRQNGAYNPPSKPPNPPNPPLFDTATVNANGVFTPGNLSLPDFTLKGTWDNSLNTITNGEIWLPYRFLWAIWGNQPTSQTPWAQINMSFLNEKITAPTTPVIMVELAVPSWGATGFTLQPNNGNAVFIVNLSGIGLGPNQGIALNISCAASSAPLSVSTSTDRQTWNTIEPGFNASVAQQCFYIAPNQIPSTTNPFYIQLMNHQAVDAVVSAAQFLY